MRQVSKETERRFVLGLQGLWPGRRWRGRAGVRDALSAIRRVQVDPLDVIGQSHDLVLASRVDRYRPEDLDAVLYEERAAYEFGGSLSIFPRDVLRLHGSWVRHEGLPLRWERWYRQHPSAVRRVRAQIGRHGPASVRTWAEGEATDDYRSRRVEGLALYVLWRRLELLIHHRDGNVKFYDRAERMFGPLPPPYPRDETIDRMALETLGWLGLSGRFGISHLRTQEDGRGRSRLTKATIRQRLVDQGRLSVVQVDGAAETAVVRTEDAPLLDEVASGNLPRSWRPISEEPEAVFLAPLDIVSTRGRARTLFDFESLVEFYKPAPQRRWGYYVLPVLLGDRLVGRIEPSYDREHRVLRVERAWWERGVDLRSVESPFARALCRTVERLGGTEVRLGRVGPSGFKSAVRALVRPGTARSPG
jgi:uncharacterized protein